MADERKREEIKLPSLPIHRNSEYSRRHNQSIVHMNYHREPYYLLDSKFETRLLEDGVNGRERIRPVRRVRIEHRTQH
jgi:hypothetical protein